MSVDLDFIQYTERMVGESSPDFADTLNRALKTVVSTSGADEEAFVGFALRPAVAPSIGQFYVATDTGVAASWQTLVTAMISDLATASTGITKVGTINTGVWQGTSIATTYTDAKVKTVTGVADKITIGGTATDPTFTIASTYAGQASIVTLGTIATGIWQGTAVGTAYTVAQVVSISGVSNRTTVSGTATVPIIDIAAAYAGQSSIVTLGTITSGTWTGASIATTYTDAKIKTVTGTVGTITVGGTSTDPIFTISAAYIGQNTITTLGTITTGVWNGTTIATANTVAQVIDVTGTTSRIAIGGTATHPTINIDTAYVGQATITTVGTIATGVWNGTSITTSFTDAKIKTVTGTSARITIGGTATDPTFDISTSYAGQATIATVGTVTVGTWAASAVGVAYGGTGLTSFAIGDIPYASASTVVSKLAIGTAAQILVTNGGATAPAWHTLVTADVTDLTSASTGITKVGTVATGTWQATVVGATYGGTGVNNGSSIITLGGSLTLSGAFTTTITVTGNTAVTLPTSGTVLTSSVTTLASLTSVGGAFAIAGALTGATTGAFSSVVTASGLTVSAAVGKIIPGATSISIRNHADAADNLIILDSGAATFIGAVAMGGAFSGATSITFTTTLKSIVNQNAEAGSYAATTATLYANDFNGATIRGYGSTYDFAVLNQAGSIAFGVLANTTGVKFQTVGFNGNNPISKPTVSGSRGSNAALASLCTALANYGLIVDGTS